MKKRLFFLCILVLFAFHSLPLHAKTQTPIYLVADFKYSKKDGVKICEIQHGTLSTLADGRDRYPMYQLFEHKLKKYKADWRLYPKKYAALLSTRIKKEMPAEYYVIKPRTHTLDNGVIVVANGDLDTVLKMILNPSPALAKNPDPGYSHWAQNKDDTFLIEKFYKSDFIRVPHPLTEKNAKGYGYHYDATMRIAFILKKIKGKMTYYSLGGFWKLPYKALEEKGTLNEKRIAYDKPPFYRSIDPTLLKEVDGKMERAMLLLYK